MKRIILCLSVLSMSVIVLPSRSSQSQTGGGPNAGRTRIVDYSRLPLSFEANLGQTDGSVKFLSRGNGYALFLTADEAVLSMRGNEGPGGGHQKRVDSPVEAAVLRMKLVGANPAPPATGIEELPGKSNYFIGNDPKKWRTNVPNYAKVRLAGVYPGVDLVYYGDQRRLEYDFVVSPGGDPSAVTLGFAGADRLEIDERGDLALQTRAGKVRWRKPLVYQEVDGVRRPIDGHYVRKGKGAVGFEVASYDRSQALVIDPILDYSTYLGGSSSEFGNGIAVDSSGKAYVTGTTISSNFPVSLGAFQSDIGGPFYLSGSDAFVAKFDTTQFDSATRVYSTYLGGSLADVGSSIAVDSSGTAYVTGTTESSNFPVTSSAYQTIISPPFDRPMSVFVTKLNAAGSALDYSTFLGGDGQEIGRGIAVDSSNPPNGYAYVTGTTFSSDFPALHGFSGSGAGFVTKLNTLASGAASLVYSSYLGGAVTFASAIAADSSGNAYVTGTVTCDPTGAWFSLPPCGITGNANPFVLKIDTNASGLPSVVYASVLEAGPSQTSAGGGIAVDSAVPPNVYVTGSTNSLIFPGTSTSLIQPTKNLGADAFVAKLKGDGSALVYSTYLGGGGDDAGASIAVDSSGNAYVVGMTNSTDLLLKNAFQSNLDGTSDAFVAKVKSDGTALAYSSYLGGSLSDNGTGIAVDASGNAYVTGSTMSRDFPGANAFQSNSGGAQDAFVAKIVDDAPVAPTISLSSTSLGFAATAGGANPADLTITVSNSGAGTLNWTAGVVPGAGWLSVLPGSGTNTGTLTVSVDIAGLAEDTYIGSIDVTDPAATNTPQTLTVYLTVTGPAHLIIIKQVVNDDGGTKTAGQFSGTINGVTVLGGNTWTGTASPGVDKTLTSAGSYSVTETTDAGYDTSYSADCNGTIAPGETLTCTVTNNDKAPPPAHLIIIKQVVNDDGGTKTAGQFSGTINGVTVQGGNTWTGTASPGVDKTLASAGSYSVTETADSGYDTSYSTDCNGTIAPGETRTCTVTNNDKAPLPAHLIIIKQVVNDDGGTKIAGQFSGTINGVTVQGGNTWIGTASPGVDKTLTSTGSYSVTETADPGYDTSYSTDCNGTIAPGEILTCTVTNDDKAAPPSTISQLMPIVQGLPGLNRGQSTSLLVRLRLIQVSIERGSIPGACAQLVSFVREVEAMKRMGLIAPATADELIASAKAIEASLGCR